MKKTMLGLLVSTLFISIHADEHLEDFESILDNASDIATKKSMNVDYLPSVVTVINAQTFRDAGIQNIAEALGMLPGIQMQLGYLGDTITTVRGFKNPNSFISDKVKVLVDGVAIYNEASGTSDFFLDFPLDLVERIEVLRGPASTVYGAGAMYGAINIITKSTNKTTTNSLYLGVGSYKNKTVGGNAYTQLGDFQLYTDAYYTDNNKSIDDDGIVTDENKEDFSVGFTLKNGGFKFLTRYKSSHYGNFYALKGDIEPNQDRGHKNNYFFSQLSYETDIHDFTLETKLAYSHRESEITAYVSNNATLFEDIFNAFGIAGVKDAFYIKEHQVEQNLEAEAILTVPEFYSNNITLGVGVRQVDITTDDFSSSLEDAIDANQTLRTHPDFPFNEKNEPGYWADASTHDIFSKTSRTISYAQLQDLISLNDRTDLILGGRVDNYSDIGVRYSSRAGIVYRASDDLILKLLYGSGFRAPTFRERYSKGHIYFRAGDKDISEESTNTYEFALVYKPNLHNRIALNLFYSTLSNVIALEEYKTTYSGYQNMKGRSSKGVELEYFFQTEMQHNFYFNATYLKAEYTVPAEETSPTEIDQEMPDISKYMFKAMYIYHPIPALSFGTTWQYYAETTRTQLLWVVNDNKDVPVNDYHLFDETITYAFSSSAQLRLTIKNLFDKEVRLPSYYYTKNGGVLREGRNYMLTFKYTF